MISHPTPPREAPAIWRVSLALVACLIETPLKPCLGFFFWIKSKIETRVPSKTRRPEPPWNPPQILMASAPAARGQWRQAVHRHGGDTIGFNSAISACQKAKIHRPCGGFSGCRKRLGHVEGFSIPSVGLFVCLFVCLVDGSMGWGWFVGWLGWLFHFVAVCFNPSS